MLYCCNGFFNAVRNLRLYDNLTHKNRMLEIGRCPKCGAIRVSVTQYRISDGKRVERKPRNTKEVKRFINKYEQEAYYEIPKLNPKFGTKSNMSWNYADGAKSGWAKDFNNVRQFKLNKDIKVVS